MLINGKEWQSVSAASACVGCEGKPAPENNPCAVCGQPAASAEPWKPLWDDIMSVAESEGTPTAARMKEWAWQLRRLAAQAHPIQWPTMPPSKGQSHVLFEDGYAEGWAKCLTECQKAGAQAWVTGSPRDWTEDAGHENGNYQCKCTDCGEFFIGHKRRVVCKVCAQTPAANEGALDMSADDIKLPPVPPGHPTYEFPDGAYDTEQMQDYARAAMQQITRS